jgi:hypothetical protein
VASATEKLRDPERVTRAQQGSEEHPLRVAVPLRSRVPFKEDEMSTTNEQYPGYTYDTCRTCGNDVLTFSLTEGECLQCTGLDPKPKGV